MVQSGALIRVAFLGVDDATPGLIRATLEHPRFELTGICSFESGTAEAADELQPLVGKIRPIANWEDLLDNSQIDAVIVARGTDQDLRAEQLRKLIQVEMPVLASHPVVDSMLVYYELDMIRRETDAPVVPELAQRQHPAIGTLAEFVRQGEASPIGKVEHLTIERCVAAPLKENVQKQFARDVDLVRAVAGDMTRLGAMAGQPADPNFASLGVQMSGPEGIDARWSVVPIHSSAGAKLTLTGPRGRATVELEEDGLPWTLEILSGDHSEKKEFANWDAAATSLGELAAIIDGRQPTPDWVDACRAIELTETIDRSLKKSRTVELYYEDYTEDATFKGTMASVGCGLLVLTIFVMALAGVAEQMKIPHVGVWRYGLLGVFVIFLLVQLIMLTSGKTRPAPLEKAGDDGS